ncbi:MAG: hypothetical protein A2408_03845 [Candidatus Yonathbacteria bacterium RIFOXYC1_FULL_52_10]|uniref:Uncharacterized protein n=1 Tax=Candidatus Yonathbacteria bacterium RIFOXYD1_FULL_52_36 TaxID=1802730 RepID=A0A1G2SIQ6_9BACT|nr:MAG: hypothetical protein A2408_03845 [Candidatus Yonathbacteria bacterium RIFOXYC1_FULL_52_10]OHA84854.1 MAG: hypothetical protein A2591_00815 [Candidatus Yonathbacteria bacterium RIFOXYD1_FULL_52_36]
MWQDFLGALMLLFGGSATIAFITLISRLWKNRHEWRSHYESDVREVVGVSRRTGEIKTIKVPSESKIDRMLQR